MLAQLVTKSEYLSSLDDLAQENPRYLWLTNYLRRDATFLDKYLNPVRQGNTRTIVADFSLDRSKDVSVLAFADAKDVDALSATLRTRELDIQVRLIFVTSISGVEKQTLKRVSEVLYLVRWATELCHSET